MEEDGRGRKRRQADGKRRQAEAGGNRGGRRKIGKRGWLCALGAEHVAEQMADGGDGVLGSNKEGA